MIALNLWLSGILIMLWLVSATATEITVGTFSEGNLEDWNPKVFAGETHYRLVMDNGRQVLRADSNGTASGLYREIPIALNRTPYLNWSWRVADVLSNVDERSKAGDDYPARVYVVASDDTFFWRTRALVYVWSSNQPIGSRWDNAFTANAKVIAVRSGKPPPGTWFNEKRNVVADFQQLFGVDINHIDAVAIMTDTDNSAQQATAWYGDLYFSKH
ncbi:MAG: DUF3047 domain-containing protein [Candidatus Competibacteraceae bacterium]|jgi:hypothetical protein|nr:DUF3047 domain-containing protein [Candidatus Competibacteraceae bacterium]